MKFEKKREELNLKNLELEQKCKAIENDKKIIFDYNSNAYQDFHSMDEELEL